MTFGRAHCAEGPFSYFYLCKSMFFTFGIAWLSKLYRLDWRDQSVKGSPHSYTITYELESALLVY